MAIPFVVFEIFFFNLWKSQEITEPFLILKTSCLFERNVLYYFGEKNWSLYVPHMTFHYTDHPLSVFVLQTARARNSLGEESTLSPSNTLLNPLVQWKRRKNTRRWI